jgi:uncharacterized membrane protein YraQ (UPF0718 family)
MESTTLAAAPAEQPRFVPLWRVAAVFWAVVGAILVARHAGVGDVALFTTFGVIFASIVIEALPFILLGAIVSALLGVYVPDSFFARIARLPRGLQLPGATIAGFGFPVCECGSVPVGRRLIDRGVHPSAAIGFMLAAPVLNPIVLSSTWVAYGGGDRGAKMLAGRAALGLLVSMAAGWGIAGRGEALLRERPGVDLDACAHDHDHDHDHDRRESFVEHLTGDFLFMGRYLMLGAAFSAALQTLVPLSVVDGIAGAFLAGTLALMGVAYVLSLCSEADAFVATSFTSFPLSSQLGFLVFGPLLDMKLTALYGATFRRRFALRLLAVAAPLIVAGTLVFGAVT